MSSNDQSSDFTHILQQTGMLKNFTIVKSISSVELEKLKVAAKKKSVSNSDYKKILDSMLSKLGDMHNPKESIPGIVYLSSEEKRFKHLEINASALAKRITQDSPSIREMAYFVTCLIAKLKLTKEDFNDLSENGDDNWTDSADDGNNSDD